MYNRNYKYIVRIERNIEYYSYKDTTENKNYEHVNISSYVPYNIICNGNSTSTTQIIILTYSINAQVLIQSWNVGDESF